MKNTLMQMPEWTLLIIAYKLWDNRTPITNRPGDTTKSQLSDIIISGLDRAESLLAGKKLPLDLTHINKMI